MKAQEESLKVTALNAWHQERGARLVDFFGWHLPVQYEGLLAEHRAVRSAAGLFDVSHMGEISVRGPGAAEGVQKLVTNDISKLAPGEILYTVACYENGGAVDDLLVYCFADESFLLVVNASNIEKDFEHFKAVLPDLDVKNRSDEYAQIALQGPASRDILLATHPDFAEVAGGLAFYNFIELELEGLPIILSRTGYTGELGYEIYLPNALAVGEARRLMSAGESAGLVPAGLGARDLLRFEAGYCLYGHELDEKTDPYEAGLSWLVKIDKGEFIGRDALLRRKGDPSARRLIGFKLPGRKFARQGFPLFHGAEEVGRVTSGSYSPSLDASLGMARVGRAFTKQELHVEIRGERVRVERVKLPFYQQPVLRA